MLEDECTELPQEMKFRVINLEVANRGVNVANKSGLIKTVINSGKVKFMYYVYEYVTDLTDEEKNQLKEEIIEKDVDGKYKQMVEDTAQIEESGIDLGGNN